MKVGGFILKYNAFSSYNESLNKEWQKCNPSAVILLMSLVGIGSYMAKVKPPLRNNWL